jgi:transcription-repair coupling factor (superfamily II helicase)
LAFKRKEYDVLLSTTVIENGIDFSNVNTIFINECQSFGLSQIHQLRGRVGRSEREGYCYLFYKKENLSDDTVKRLKTIVKYSYLGS